MHVMEFDYPSASFGANGLSTGATYHYRFKVQGSGVVSLQYEDAAGKTRTATGPKVDLGDQGSLMVTVDPAGAVTWTANLTNPK
jgi:phosphodiesterase/alkaline phosphatase D-like protein